MKCSKITDEQEKQIIDLYRQGMTYINICRELNLKHDGIIRLVLKYNNIQSNRIPKRKYYTKDQIDFLYKYYPLYGASFCAEKLKIKVKIIGAKARDLGLKRIYITEDGLKPCQKCHTLKPLEKFNKAKKSKHTGLFTFCKDCKNQEKRIKTKNDPQFRIRNQLASSIQKAIKKQKTIKSAKTLELLGCSLAEVEKHLESQFTPNMNWDNQGLNGWEIDHIKPCWTFDLTVPEQQKVCFNWANLRPLWKTDDLAKKMGDFGMVGNINRNAHQYQDDHFDISIKPPISPTSSFLASQGVPSPFSACKLQKLSPERYLGPLVFPFFQTPL